MKINIKSITMAVTCFLLISVFFGCETFPYGVSTSYATGRYLTPEEIESIFDEISIETDEAYPTETYEDGELSVFWLKGGSVWHISRSCASVAESDPNELFVGRISDAINAGKKRACKRCAPEYQEHTETESVSDSTAATETTEINKYSTEYDQFGNLIVYWLKGGSVWHESKQCSVVAKADESNLICGNIADALSAGKKRSCKICSSGNVETTADSQLPETDIITDTVADKYPKSYDKNGQLIVYWLKNGTVWHESCECSAVKKSSPESLNIGSAQDAVSAGMLRACKICSAR